MKTSNEQVLKLAALSRLALSAEEVTKFADEIPAILEYVGKLSRVNTEGVPVYELNSIPADSLRADQVQPISEETRKAIIESFPDRLGNLLKVKSVFAGREKQNHEPE